MTNDEWTEVYNQGRHDLLEDIKPYVTIKPELLNTTCPCLTCAYYVNKQCQHYKNDNEMRDNCIKYIQYIKDLTVLSYFRK